MALEIVLITGMSGSGKSVALHALEDAHQQAAADIVAPQHVRLGELVAAALPVSAQGRLSLAERVARLEQSQEEGQSAQQNIELLNRITARMAATSRWWRWNTVTTATALLSRWTFEVPPHCIRFHRS